MTARMVNMEKAIYSNHDTWQTMPIQIKHNLSISRARITWARATELEMVYQKTTPKCMTTTILGWKPGSNEDLFQHMELGRLMLKDSVQFGKPYG